MDFNRIPGQEEARARLIRTVREQRVSHAQLFTGPEGCGSMALALAYARYISCENRTDTDSCGKCKSCVKYEKMIHPDLHFVFPVTKGKKAADPVSDTYIEEWREFVSRSPFFSPSSWFSFIDVGNAQGLIYVSEASEIIRKLSLKTFESDFKIMIIWLPERMHPTPANKLLKLIEEPPEKTIFLLVSEEPDKVIPTILSRCQIVRIPAFRQDDIAVYLGTSRGLEPGKASDIARVSGGNINRALELSDDDEASRSNLDRFRGLMRFAWKRDILSLISWSEEMAATGREAQKSFFIFALRMLRENLMLALGQQNNSSASLSAEEADFSKNFNPFINTSNIYPLTGEFSLGHSHIEANGNAKIIFLDLALKVTKVLR
ncbi:MAG: DNA polymerase III subunit delta [Bacteroidales bacterium]|jgi:DNA polymerase-3 subunit delta'|nr:DNA polymerase III subunit delta [Bacteroidales bacterium]MCU0407895.1 DNA polymerase III subunit delta [Bacteroidales bacterium]